MIARLTGKIAELRDNYLILDVHGVGYKVENFAPYRLGLEGMEVVVEIYTHVREEEIRLFGFANRAELELFEKLLTVSGVGPKSAMLLTSNYSPRQISSAIERGDQAALLVKGIGAKTIAKILIELKGKVNLATAADDTDSQTVTQPVEPVNELTEALLGLGYKLEEVKRILPEVKPDLPFAQQVKQALALISA